MVTLLFKQFPRSFVGPFIYSTYSLWNDAREDKCFLFWNAAREHWRVGVAGMMVKNCLRCEHSNKCPEFSSEHHAESSYYPTKLQPWSGPRPSHLPSWNIPCSGKREHEVWWGGMRKVGRSFSLVHYQGDKQVKAISLVKLAQCPAQAMTNAYTTSGQEDGSFLLEAHGLWVFNGSSKQDLPKVKSLWVERHMRM